MRNVKIYLVFYVYLKFFKYNQARVPGNISNDGL